MIDCYVSIESKEYTGQPNLNHDIDRLYTIVKKHHDQQVTSDILFKCVNKLEGYVDNAIAKIFRYYEAIIYIL